MPFKDIQTRTKIFITTLLPLSFLLILGWLNVTGIEDMQATERWVRHTNGVLNDSSKIVNSAVDMETGMRGYLLTGKDEFLQPFEKGRERNEQAIDRLKVTVADNPEQVKRLEEAQSILADWKRTIAIPYIDLRRTIGDSHTLADMGRIVAKARGKAYFDSFRSQVASFIDREEGLLTQRQDDLVRSLSTAPSTSIEQAVKWVHHAHRVINLAYALLLAGIDMETGMRGYLLSGEPEFLQPYEAGLAAFDGFANDLEQTVSANPSQVKLLRGITKALQEWREKIAVPMISLRSEIRNSKNVEALSDEVGKAKGKAYFDAFRNKMSDFEAEEQRLMTLRTAQNNASVENAQQAAIATIIGALFIGCILAYAVGGLISTPITNMAAAMRSLASGDHAVKVPGEDRHDEVGQMAAAVHVFKVGLERAHILDQEKDKDQQGREKRRLAIELATNHMSDVIGSVAQGDLARSVLVDSDSGAGLVKLSADLNSMIQDLRHNHKQDAEHKREKEEAERGKEQRRVAMEEATKRMSQIMRHVADGDLTRTVHSTGKDGRELLDLATSLNEMIGNLKGMSGDVRDSSDRMATTLAEVRSAISAQASGASEQAAAVNETMATLEEIKVTSDQTLEKVGALGNSAEKSQMQSDRGGQAVREAVESMKAIHEQVDAVARSVLELSQKTSQIGEITDVVNGLAIQSKMLSLNASIEAAKAGEAGQGFSVVAEEIRILAEQSQESTSQVKEVLQDIQHSTERTVMVAEEGTKQAAEGIQRIEGAEKMIADLASVVRQTATASQQIVAVVRQEAAGIDQIREAMEDITKSSLGTLSATNQSKRAIEDLTSVSDLLRDRVQVYRL
jgi:methyl-accepting chemotaxis protein